MFTGRFFMVKQPIKYCCDGVRPQVMLYWNCVSCLFGMEKYMQNPNGIVNLIKSMGLMGAVGRGGSRDGRSLL